MNQHEFNRWAATEATTEQLSRAVGSAMGGLVGQLGRDVAQKLINEIWRNMLEGIEQRFGIDLDTFKGTGAK